MFYIIKEKILGRKVKRAKYEKRKKIKYIEKHDVLTWTSLREYIRGGKLACQYPPNAYDVRACICVHINISVYSSQSQLPVRVVRAQMMLREHAICRDIRRNVAQQALICFFFLSFCFSSQEHRAAAAKNKDRNLPLRIS